MKKLSIIMPAYNEEKRIGGTLERYGNFFSRLNNKIMKTEIIVVINNTSDNTEEVVKKYIKKYKIIRYILLKKGGKGYAITEGFKYSLKNKENSIIGFVDADLATSPEAFYDLVKNMRDLGGLIASRYIAGAIINPKQTFARIGVSRIFNFLIRALFLFNYKDTQCGAKIFKREVIENIIQDLKITQWAFDIDLLYCARKKGFNIKEYPTIWADKEYSKINFMRAGPKMALAIIRLRLINSRLNFIVRGYDLFLDIIKEI